MATMAWNRKIIINSFLFLFCLLLVFYRIFSLWNSLLPDFHVFYYATTDLLHQKNPYIDTFLFTGLGYPIFALFFFIPFTFLPFPIASKVFLLLNVFSLGYIIFLSLSLLQKYSLRNFLFFLLLCLFFFPVIFTLGMGQSNLLALMFLLAGIFLKKRFDFFPGILLSLSILIKPIFIIFFLFFFLEKHWKILFTSFLFISLAITISVKLFGIYYYGYYITSLVPHLLSLSGREIYYNQGFTGFIARLTPNLMLRKIIPSIGGLFLVCYLFVMKFQKISYEHILSAFCIVLVLIDTLSWQHHFVFLIFPFITAYFTILEKKEKNILFLLLGISYILVGYNIPNPLIFSRFPTTLLLSHVFFGTLLLLFIFSYVNFNWSFLQNKKVINLSYIVFIFLVLVEYFVFIMCRGHICLL